MDLPKAYGTFIKRDDKIFRTEAKLKWGNSDELIGLLIMLNPGSSKLLDNDMWCDFVDGTYPTDTINGELILDDTMKEAVNILESSHQNLNGTLVIHNLFNLRDSESENALATYKRLFDKEDYKSLSNSFSRCVKNPYQNALHSELSYDYIDTFPWIWLAWTVEDGKFINARRRQIINSIPSQKKVYAIYSRQACHQKHKELYTYHVCPRNPLDKEAYAYEMIKLMSI